MPAVKRHRVVLFAVVLPALASCEPPPGTGSSTSSSSGSSGSPGSSGATASATGRRPLDAQALCARLVDECMQPLTKPDCLRSFGGLRVTDACVDEISRATCAELASTSSTVSRTCFPPCSGDLGTCNEDGSLTFCTAQGNTRVADCQASCLTDGFSGWTGVCGTSHDGQVSERAQCWCQ